MNLLLGVTVALLLGAVWVLLLRRSPRRRTLPGAPKEVAGLLTAYRRGRWDDVIDGAPAVLARDRHGGGSSDDSDVSWRPAAELAFGHALVERDRPDEAIEHLERGLLLQSARRRAQGRGGAPEAGEAKMRHLLGWAYAAAGHTAQARREYRRVLDTPGLDPEVRRRVEGGLDALR